LEKNDADRIEAGEEIVLVLKGSNEEIATMQIESKYKINKTEVVNKWFGTTSLEHPGVKNIMSKGDILIGGKINLFNRIMRKYKYHELTPAQTRKIFESMGWTKILGFHTRNVIHRSHEYIQLEGLSVGNCDGLFVHPIVGKKKKGDFDTGIIIDTYEQMVKLHYPKNKIIMGTFATFSRYAGPREALFTAICRQNFGCSHFIIGRDHTGIGSFYEPDASQRIFDHFDDLEIKLIKFGKVFYCTKCKDYVQEKDCKHDSKYHLTISGTQIREIINKGDSPPEWAVRKEISNMILDRKNGGHPIFVE
jgi:sulfate adenylyltransferase